jgi:hypothetical protein
LGSACSPLAQAICRRTGFAVLRFAALRGCMSFALGLVAQPFCVRTHELGLRVRLFMPTALPCGAICGIICLYDDDSPHSFFFFCFEPMSQARRPLSPLPSRPLPAVAAT